MKRNTRIIMITLTITSLWTRAGQPAGSLQNASDVIEWTFRTGKAIYTQPVIHENTLYIGSLDSVFYAVNPQNGDEIWHYRTDHPIQSDAAVFEKGVCFESGNQLTFLDFEGQLIRKIPLYTESVTDQIDTWDLQHSSPNIVNGVVYIGTEKGWIYGIEADTGEEVFKVQTPNQGTIRVMPLIDGNRLYAGDWDGVMLAYDLGTSELLWQYDMRNDVQYAWTNAIQTRLVIVDGMLLFAGRSCKIVALSADTGERLWDFDQPNVWIVGGAAVSDGLVYYGCSNQRVLYAQDIETGANRWGLSIDHRMWNVPLIVENNLYFGAGDFWIVDKTTGEVVNLLRFNPDSVHQEPVHLWYWDADYYADSRSIANFHSSAIAFENKIIVGCDNGKLYAFNREKLLSMPKAESAIHEGEIQLGDISLNETPGIAVTVFNTGTKNDTLQVSLAGATKLLKALTLYQEEIIVPAGDSAAVEITLSPANLKVTDYIFRILIVSRQNVGNNNMTQVVRFNLIESTSVQAHESVLPENFALDPNHPNPFNPVTNIDYDLPVESDVVLQIFDLQGRLIETLIRGPQSAGRHHILFDAHRLASGVYVCILNAGPLRASQKMTLLK